jgi:phage tail-like protein
MASSPYTQDIAGHTLASDPIRNFRFLVSFTAQTGDANFQKNFSGKVGFVSVSGLNVTTESIAYREGGYNTTVHQIPGMTTFSPVTMNRGVVLGSDQNVNWMRRLFTVTTNSAKGGIGSDFRCNVEIAVLGHPNAAALQHSGGAAATGPESMFTAMRFKLYNAWITNLAYSDLNAGDNALLVESITLVHEGWDVTYASGYSASAPAFTV